MKIVICGPAQSGKSTIGRRIAKALGTQAVDTSEAIVVCEEWRQKVMWERAGLEREIDTERSRPHRDYLIALGDALKKAFGPTILADYCFKHGDVCVGVRAQDELDAIVLKYDPVVVEVYTDLPTVSDNFDIVRWPRRKVRVFNKNLASERTRDAHLSNVTNCVVAFGAAFGAP